MRWIDDELGSTRSRMQRRCRYREVKKGESEDAGPSSLEKSKNSKYLDAGPEVD